MRKEHNLVRLPTEKSSLHKNYHNLFITDTVRKQNIDDTESIPQHLHITSDEEIKEGDWFIGGTDGKLIVDLT